MVASCTRKVRYFLANAQRQRQVGAKMARPQRADMDHGVVGYAAHPAIMHDQLNLVCPRAIGEEAGGLGFGIAESGRAARGLSHNRPEMG